MLGRLNVATEVMIENNCCLDGSIVIIAALTCKQSCGAASRIASPLLMYVDWLCTNVFLASNIANSLIKMNIAGDKITRGIKRQKWNTEGREKPNTNQHRQSPRPATPSPRIIMNHPMIAVAGEGDE